MARRVHNVDKIVMPGEPGSRKLIVKATRHPVASMKAALGRYAVFLWILMLPDDARSRDKGVEPEGIALLAIQGRTFAFVGLERTLKSAVAVFDITEPTKTSFVDMIVTDGDRAPEGLVVYQRRGVSYLAIANEGSGTTGEGANTTVYRIQLMLPRR